MSNTFWSNLNKYDKRKLIYAYIVSPLLIMAFLGGNFKSDAYRQTGQVITPPCGAIFALAMTSYIPTILPPIVIRFWYFKRPLSYGLELFISMWVSIIFSLLALFLMTGIPAGTLGLLGSLTVYCVLSYGSIGHNDILKQKRYALTGLTLAVPFIVFQMFGAFPQQGFGLAWEAVFIAIMVNCHLPQQTETRYSSSNYSNEPPPPPPHEDAQSSRQDDAIRLVNLGLAAIGRKTKRTNLYLTPERETERHRAEHPFLRQLAEKYRDADTRKVLAKHFMLYKETCLYVIFSVVLKGDAELHSLVKDELTERLTEDLSVGVQSQRKQYMYAFSRAFYDEYQRTHNMERTLSYTFWCVLADKHPELVSTYELSRLLNMVGLGNVYRYSYDTMKRYTVNDKVM